MSKITDMIDDLTRGIEDEGEKREIIKKFFIDDAEQFKQKVETLSDEELDAIAGGAIIGDIYACEAHKSECVSLGTGVDICNILYDC